MSRKIALSDPQRRLHVEIEEAGGELLVDLANLLYRAPGCLLAMEGDVFRLVELGLAALTLSRPGDPPVPHPSRAGLAAVLATFRWREGAERGGWVDPAHGTENQVCLEWRAPS